MMAMTTELTPTEQRLYDILSDGLAHPSAQLHATLGDDMTDMVTLRMHISNLRRKLQHHGRDIAARQNGHTSYRLVRYLTDDD